MANTINARGLWPLKHLFGGQVREASYDILQSAGTGYATSIFAGDPVKLANDGTIQVAAVGDTCIGIFAGCSFVDSAGLQVPFQRMYTASQAVQAGSRIVANVWDDPNIEFGIQVGSTDAFALTNVGNNADFSAYAAGSTATGQSIVTLNINGISSATATFRILGLIERPDNAYGANADVRVKFNEHAFLTTTGV
jgi:hypothetical protein